MVSAPTLLASLEVKDLLQVKLPLEAQQNMPKSYPVVVLFFSDHWSLSGLWTGRL